MSRIGKKPVAVPKGVTVTVDGQHGRGEGPEGRAARARSIPRDMLVSLEDGKVIGARPSDEKRHKALHGLTRTLIANMVEGVTKGFARRSRSRASATRPSEAVRGEPHRRLLAPGRVRAPKGIKIYGAATTRWSRSRARTRRSSARWPRSSARCARRSRTRARASSTRASRSAARRARREPSNAHAIHSRRRGAEQRYRRHLRVRNKVRGTRSVRGWWCSARSSTSTRSWSTTTAA